MPLPTESFVEGLIQQGISHLCVVPCSFAKDLINAAINNPAIEYLPCASEAIACSTAAGLKMAGKLPLVIVQSSGLANMGSCITSLLEPNDVQFPIITSWRTYEEGDSEIQHKHLATELFKLIQAYGYTPEILNNTDLDFALSQVKQLGENNKIGVLQKDSFSQVQLLPEHCLDLSHLTPRSKFLQQLNARFAYSPTLFIGTTGNTAREMYGFMPDTHNFYMVGNMGGALALGLGAAKASKPVIVIGGDAEFVMHMGGLSTVGRYADSINLTYLLFDNESNKSTGGQNTYQNHLNYIQIAEACGFNCQDNIVFKLEEFTAAMEKLQQLDGLSFMHIKCGTDPEVPRPPLAIVKRNYF